MKYDNRNLSFLLARILVLFWALWWSIAFITDVLGVLQHLQLLSGSMFDENYPEVKKVLAEYTSVGFLPAVIFAVILIWEFLSAVTLLWAASLSFNADKWLKATLIGFTVSISLWLFFLLGSQVFLTFDLEVGDMTQAGFQLLSLILIIMLDRTKNNKWWSF